MLASPLILAAVLMGAPPAEKTPPPAPEVAPAPVAAKGAGDVPTTNPIRDVPTYRTTCPDCPALAEFVNLDQLHDFAHAMEKDPRFAPSAAALTRPNPSTWLIVGGFAIGAGVGVLGLTQSESDCTFHGDGSAGCESSPNVPLLLTAGAIAAAGVVAGYLTDTASRPTQDEVIVPLNRWNVAHPEARFEYDPVKATLLPVTSSATAADGGTTVKTVAPADKS